MNLHHPQAKLLLRVLLLAAGLTVFGWFIHRAGPAEIWRTLSRLGWLAPIALLPLGAVYSMETWGWHFAFGAGSGSGLRYRTLWRIRLCGEAVNNVVPSATVGGEAVKVYLLQKRGVPVGRAAVATIVGRTVQTLMQVTFIALGTAAFFHIAQGRTAVRLAMAGLLALSVGLVIGMFYLQSHGMFAVLLNLAAKLHLPFARSPAQRATFLRIDQQVLRFYRRDRRDFVRSAACYLSAWLLDTFDVFLVSVLLGMAINWPRALAIEAFISVVRLLGFLIPGGLGIQESGIALVCGLAGLPAEFGPAYAVIRRGRDLSYAALGWAMLYLEETNLRALTARARQETVREL